MFRLDLSTNNAAFEDAAAEVARILRGVADKIEGGQTSGPVRDSNGNRVGSWELEHAAKLLASCSNCGEDIELDDNGAGGTVWVHTFGSTVCHDDPPGSHDTTTTAEPASGTQHEAERVER